MLSAPNRGVVLLVEDDEDDAFFFRRAFGKTGYGNPVHRVPDGLAAIHYLSGEGEYADRAQFPTPIMLVLDLNTPRRHGIEVLRWIRSRPEFASLVVVVLTSSNSEVDVAACYELGVNSYVVKTTETEGFVQNVQLMATYWLGLNRAPESRKR